MTKSAVGYTRLSQQSDTSIDRQKRHIREYSDDHDLNLGRIYDDGEGSSGFTVDREEYQELVELIEIGAIDAVVVNDLRRLARDYDATLELVLTLRKNNIEVHTWQDGRKNLDDPMASSFELIKAAAEYESKLNEIEKAREAVQERVEAGQWQGRAPIGTKHGEGPHGLEPTDDLERVLDVLEAKREGASHAEALRAGDMDDRPRNLVTRMLNKDRLIAYRDLAAEEDIEFPHELIVEA